MAARHLDRESGAIHAHHEQLGTYWLYCEDGGATLFTENETNRQLLFNAPNASPYVKDAFHRYLVDGEMDSVNPEMCGTKAAIVYKRTVPAGDQIAIKLRLKKHNRALSPLKMLATEFDRIFAQSKSEADEFYSTIIPPSADEDTRNVMRQALAGALWSKQYYHYVVRDWYDGGSATPVPPEPRKQGRNSTWKHIYNADIISMPDKWEFPWYAAWDLAFHCIALSLVDPDFAKRQLVLMLREWYMHPNGQIPAYEWSFDDVNPPVHAWAAWRVYKIDKRITGRADRRFLERVFHKLLLNFTWWVNRKDSEGHNVFQGGFLGLDNIGVFDRSAPLPTGGHLEQSDGTAWMGMYCLNMLMIALELARENRTYEDVATKFFEHFLYIADALNNIGGEGISLWDEEDQFFYDVLHMPDGSHVPLKVRSLVGFIPLLAVETIEPGLLDALPEFKARLEWFLEHRPPLLKLASR